MIWSKQVWDGSDQYYFFIFNALQIFLISIFCSKVDTLYHITVNWGKAQTKGSWGMRIEDPRNRLIEASPVAVRNKCLCATYRGLISWNAGHCAVLALSWWCRASHAGCASQHTTTSAIEVASPSMYDADTHKGSLTPLELRRWWCRLFVFAR